MDLPGPVAAADQQVLPRLHVQPVQPEPAVHDEVAHQHQPTAGPLLGEPGGEAQRRGRTAHLVALGDLEATARVLLAPGQGAVDPGALEGVHELVVVGGPPPVGDGAGADPGGGPQQVELVLLGGVRLLPAPPGVAPVLLVGGPAAPEAATAPAVGAERAGVEVDEVGGDVVEEHPVVAGEQHHPRQVPQEPGRAPPAPRRRGGWSARRGAGRPAGWSSRWPGPAGCAARPTASRRAAGGRGRPARAAPPPGPPDGRRPTRRGPAPTPAPGRTPRRTAGSSSVAASRSTSATARRSGASVRASTSATDASSGNGGSWPSITRSSGRSTVPATVARAGSRPATARSRVDLPAPFSPTRPTRRPGGASRSIPVRTGRAPKATDRSRTTRGSRVDGADMGGPSRGAGTRRAPPERSGRGRESGQAGIHMMARP